MKMKSIELYSKWLWRDHSREIANLL